MSRSTFLGFFLMLGIPGAVTAVADEFPAFEKLPALEGLPLPLKMFDGTPVTTREQWFEKRRPELKRLFQHYMYGAMPAAPDNVKGTIAYENTKLLDGKATLREIHITYGPPGVPVLRMLLVLPNERAGKVPLFLGLNFRGNHAVTTDEHIALPPEGSDEKAKLTPRGGQAGAWPLELFVEKGYGLATAWYGDIDPDKHDFTDGVHPHYLAKGATQPGPHDWGSISAWAWGMSRMFDYLQTLPEVDASRIAAYGHSRLGKTALLAGAFDERFAFVTPHQSGTGGCALSRNNDQETVERINRVFPHWFNDEFTKFGGGNESKLPIDQHLLMCLVAPRAIFDTEGDQDKWANYDNGYKALQAADEVYKFLGLAGLREGGLIRQEEPIDGPKFGELIQYRRDYKHEATPEFWAKTIEFANAYYAKRKP